MYTFEEFFVAECLRGSKTKHRRSARLSEWLFTPDVHISINEFIPGGGSRGVSKRGKCIVKSNLQC